MANPAVVLGLDTSTPASAVGLLAGPRAFAAVDRPAAGARPGHAAQLLALVEQVLDRAGLALGDVERLAVGRGPGGFTGLRIGVATARALAQGTGRPLVGVPSLQVLALGALGWPPAPERTVLAVLDARRGEAFAAAYRGPETVLAPRALAPEALAGAARALGPGVPAVGEGALRFRGELELAGAVVAPDGSPRHLLDPRLLCRLAAGWPAARPETVLPDYARAPDAQEALRRRP